MPTGTSEEGASTRLTLMDRIDRKLSDLSFLSLEKTSDELLRIRNTRPWTSRNTATLASVSPSSVVMKDPSMATGGEMSTNEGCCVCVCVCGVYLTLAVWVYKELWVWLVRLRAEIIFTWSCTQVVKWCGFGGHLRL